MLVSFVSRCAFNFLKEGQQKKLFLRWSLTVMRWQSRVELDHSDDEIIMTQQVEFFYLISWIIALLGNLQKSVMTALKIFTIRNELHEWEEKARKMLKSLPRRQLRTYNWVCYESVNGLLIDHTSRSQSASCCNKYERIFDIFLTFYLILLIKFNVNFKILIKNVQIIVKLTTKFYFYEIW